jgi:hypothetical protein
MAVRTGETAHPIAMPTDKSHARMASAEQEVPHLVAYRAGAVS